jgi:hypothetical protein
MIGEMFSRHTELAPVPPADALVEHVSISCEHCSAHLEFTVLEGQDEAIELDNARHAAKWNYVQGGLGCDACSRETIEIARLDTRHTYSKPARIR